MPSTPQQPAQDEAANEARPDPPRRRHVGRWLAVIALLVVMSHVPLLEFLGGWFQNDDAFDHADAAVILGGDHRHDVAANLFREGRIGGVWLIEERPDYLVTAGVLPPRIVAAREGLIAAGIPRDRLETIGQDADDLVDVARIVKSMLEARPKSEVVILCPALSGRHVRFIVDDVLEEQLSERVHIAGLPYDSFAVERWWRSRTGLKQLFGEICVIGFTWLQGTEPREVDFAFDPDEFERDLTTRIGGAACYDF